MEENAPDTNPFTEPVTRVDYARLGWSPNMGIRGRAGQSGPTRPRDILSKLREAQSRPGSVLLQLRSPLSGGLAHLLVTISKSGGRAGDPADYHAADELGSPADETARPDGLA
jgi:hypothetical protein